MDWYQERARRIEAAWGETVAGLPIGTRVTGVVIETRPFGSFVELDGWPEALGLAKVSRMPHGMVLPAPGSGWPGRCTGTRTTTTRCCCGSTRGHEKGPTVRWGPSSQVPSRQLAVALGFSAAFLASAAAVTGAAAS